MAFGLSGRCFTAEIQSIYLYPALEEARLAPKRIYGGTMTSIRQSIRYQYTGTPTDPKSPAVPLPMPMPGRVVAVN